MPIDLGRLRVFHEVARTGSFGGAAKVLHVTPSAVSHALRKLQDGLGRELLDWRGRTFILTAEGEALRETSLRVFGELEETERQMERGAAGGPIRVVLGSTIEFGTTVLVPKLRPLLERHPGLRLDFRFAHDLAGPLLRDEIDLAVDCKPHTHPAVHGRRMFREKYVVVASPAFAKGCRLRSPLDLRRTPVLSLDREGHWWNNMLRALPAARRPVLEQIVVIDHLRGMINGTLCGYGVALLPKYAILTELADGRLTVLFPRLRLLEDFFCLYQKVARATRPANLLVGDFLLGLEVREFGDAIGRRRSA